MTSKVEICNLALVEAKYDETIESMTERSVAAERCNRLYDVCRKELLCNFPWVFATKFVKLARVSDKKIDGALYAYTYPKQALRIVNIFKNEKDYHLKNFRVDFPDNTRVAYIEGQKVILTHYEEPFAEIVYDEQIEENFPPLFVRMLYLELAVRLAKLSSADSTDMRLLMTQLQSEGEKAKMQSVGEDDNHLCVEDDYYIRVRG